MTPAHHAALAAMLLAATPVAAQQASAPAALWPESVQPTPSGSATNIPLPALHLARPTPVAVAAPPPTGPALEIPVGVGIVTDAGILPAPGLGVEARVTFAVDQSLFVLRGTLWLPRVATLLPGIAVQRLQFTLASAGFQYCRAHVRGVFSLRLCGALDVGEMRVSGGAFAPSESSGALWAATFAEFGLGWRPTHDVGFHLDVGPGVTLVAPRYTAVTEMSPGVTFVAFQPSALLLRAALVVDFTFR